MLSQTEFADAFVQHARSRGFSVHEESDVEFAIRDQTGFQTKVSVANAYLLYLDTPVDPESVFQKLLFAASAPQFAIKAEQLVAMVRTNEFKDVISRRLTGHLSLIVAADVGDAFIYPTEEKLREVGLSPSEAIDASVSNVDRLAGHINMGESAAGFRVFFSSAGISSSLMLSNGFQKAMTNLVGDPVFLPAARNALLVASAADSGTLVAMRKMARDTSEPHPITDKVVKYDEGSWLDLG